MPSVIELHDSSPKGQIVYLVSGETRAAKLSFTGAEFPFLKYKFEPLPAWSSLASKAAVFSARDIREGLAGIDARMKAIEDLDLWLISEDGRVVVGDFLLLLRNDRATVRELRRGSRPGEAVRKLKGRG